MLVQISKHETKVAEHVSGKECNLVTSADIVDPQQFGQCAVGRTDDIKRFEKLLRFAAQTLHVCSNFHHGIQLLRSVQRALCTLSTSSHPYQQQHRKTTTLCLLKAMATTTRQFVDKPARGQSCCRLVNLQTGRLAD